MRNPYITSILKKFQNLTFDYKMVTNIYMKSIPMRKMRESEVFYECQY